MDAFWLASTTQTTHVPQMLSRWVDICSVFVPEPEPRRPAILGLAKCQRHCQAAAVPQPHVLSKQPMTMPPSCSHLLPRYRHLCWTAGPTTASCPPQEAPSVAAQLSLFIALILAPLPSCCCATGRMDDWQQYQQLVSGCYTINRVSSGGQPPEHLSPRTRSAGHLLRSRSPASGRGSLRASSQAPAARR